MYIDVLEKCASLFGPPCTPWMASRSVQGWRSWTSHRHNTHRRTALFVRHL